MKLKTKSNSSTSPVSTPKLSSGAVIKLADELGQSYEEISERTKANEKVKGELSQRIKQIASEVGERNGAACTLSGKVFCVGFQEIEARKSVNWEKFALKYPRIWQKVSRLQIDEALVSSALEDGSLPKELLEKFIVTTGSPSQRILVKRVGNED